MDDDKALHDVDTRLMTMRAAHRSLDARIDQLVREGTVDQLSVQRLKRQRLELKDRIAQLERDRIPDIIA